MGEDVDLLEPCMSTQSTIGAVLLQNVSETLTYLDVGGGTGLQPKLAESWEQQADGSWRFKLRQGVSFSDGSGFDAKDVKHSFDRAMSDQITCEVKRYFGGMTVNAEVVDGTPSISRPIRCSQIYRCSCRFCPSCPRKRRSNSPASRLAPVLLCLRVDPQPADRAGPAR